MSQQGLETIESTTQKTHEWIAQVAEALHLEKFAYHAGFGCRAEAQLLNLLVRERASASGWRCEKTLDDAPKTTIATDGSAFG